MTDVVFEGCIYERPTSTAYVVGVDNAGMMKRVYLTNLRPLL